MRILIACETSGALRNAFTSFGAYAMSCDLKDSQSSGLHYKGDIFDVIYNNWDIVIAFPPCTYLSKVQMFRYSSQSDIIAKRNEAVSFVQKLYLAVPRIAIENPPGYLNNNWRAPSQIIYPWYFGDPYSKAICLWLKNCPPVISTLYSPIRKSVDNHINGRMSSARKSEIRSSWIHFPGMCRSIAKQYLNIPV